MGARRQGIFWLLTIPHYSFTPWLPRGCSWIRGQLESGEGGFLHWQLVVSFSKKVSLAQVKECFGPTCHAELSRSEAVDSYVWKDDTSVSNTRFELGAKPIRRNSVVDWESVWDLARSGSIESIPASIRVQSYRTLRSIAADYAKPVALERTVYVFWGATGTGKSKRAWCESGFDAYPKDPRSKFWCGYRDHENVVIDEFRGGIDVGHMLRWLDRYPVIVEIKGGSVVLKATKFWITSNLDPRLWYPELDSETVNALIRRLNITHFHYFQLTF